MQDMSLSRVCEILQNGQRDFFSSIQSYLDPHQLMLAITECIRISLNVDRCAIATFDLSTSGKETTTVQAESLALGVKSQQGTKPMQLYRPFFDLASTPKGQQLVEEMGLAPTNNQLIFTDLPLIQKFDSKLVWPFEVRALALTPIIVAKNFAGSLVVNHSRARRFSADECQLMLLLAAQISNALTRRWLCQPKTLANRQKVISQIENLLPKALKIEGRQLEVLAELAGGSTDVKIGKSLGIAPRTVGHHLREIRQKTRHKNRSELLAWVLSLVMEDDSLAS
jgi:DNA-binding CsgD family transcriptional regulator